MSVKFVQDVEIASAKLKLSNTTTSTIETGGALNVIGNADGQDNLSLGAGTLDWKSIAYNGGAHTFRNNNVQLMGLDADGDLLVSGDVTADSFIVEGGSSSGFLKADGSIDSTSYSTGSSVTNNNQLTNGANYITSASLPTDFVSAANGGTFNGNIVTFGDSYVSGKIGNLDVSGGQGFQFETPSSSMQTLRTDSDAFRIYFGGSGGIGTAYNITQGGQHDWDGGSGNNRMRLTANGNLHVDGDITGYSTTVSDVSMKDNVKTIENATETVKALRGVSYDWNKGSRKGKSEIGLIAQEVEQVLPNLVHDKELLDGSQVKTVDYQKIIGLLIESNKELSDRLDSLEGCSCKK